MINKGLKREILNKKMYYSKLAVNGLISTTASFFQGFFIAYCINSLFIQKSLVIDIWMQLAILLGVFAFKGLILYYIENQIIDMSAKIKNSIRLKVLKRIMEKGPQNIREEGSGAFLTSLCEGGEKIEKYFSEYIPSFIHMIVAIPILTGIVLYYDRISFGIMVFVLPFLPIFMILIAKEAGNKNEKYFKELKIMGGHFFDLIKGIAEIRFFSNEGKRIVAVEKVSEDFRKITMSILKISFLSAFVLEFSSTISTAIIAVSLGLRLLYGHIDFFTAFLVLLLTPEVFAPVKNFGAKFHVAMSSVAAFESVKPYLDNSESRLNHDKAFMNGHEMELNKKEMYMNELSSSPITLSLKNISFAYLKAQGNILNKVNISILPGEITLLTGPSGSGKSTILSILLGLLKEYEGEIFINDKIISKERLCDLKDFISIVTQRTFIFNSSILENVSISKEGADKKSVEEALENAGATFCRELPQGIDTILSEDGVSLSIGQAQRIALARGFLKNSPLIILDEPTDALDEENEQYIIDSIIKLKELNKSILIISHKSSFKRICDVEYCIENGFVIKSFPEGEK